MRLIRFEAWDEDPEKDTRYLYVNPEEVTSAEEPRAGLIWLRFIDGCTVQVRADDLDDVIAQLEHDPRTPMQRVFPLGDSTSG